MSRPVSRRAALRGLFGVTLALPTLEWTHAQDLADPSPHSPHRFVLAYAGMSTGADHGGDAITPQSDGVLESSRALSPLFELGVDRHVTLVSGLEIPWQTDGDVPPAGRPAAFHYQTAGPLVAGTRSDPVRGGVPTQPTADQRFAAQHGGTPIDVLAYGVQPVTYVGANESGGNAGRLSWRYDSSGALVPVDPIVSPRSAFEALVGLAPANPEAEAAIAHLARRRSVLDLVGARTKALESRLGRADRLRLEQHYQHVRELEQQLDALDPSAACTAPAAPVDPPIGGAIIPWEDHQAEYSATQGYSGEDVRAAAFVDLIAFAFACDLSRSSSLLLSHWKSYMNMHALGGWESDLHGLNHSASTDAVADGIAYHTRQLARLVERLDATPAGFGASLLERTAVVLLFEGGFGEDAEGSLPVSSHSTQNMVALVAGGPLGPGGRHVRREQAHPGAVCLKALRAVGVTGPLGEIDDPVEL